MSSHDDLVREAIKLYGDWRSVYEVTGYRKPKDAESGRSRMTKHPSLGTRYVRGWSMESVRSWAYKTKLVRGARYYHIRVARPEELGMVRVTDEQRAAEQAERRRKFFAHISDNLDLFENAPDSGLKYVVHNEAAPGYLQQAGEWGHIRWALFFNTTEQAMKELSRQELSLGNAISIKQVRDADRFKHKPAIHRHVEVAS